MHYIPYSCIMYLIHAFYALFMHFVPYSYIMAFLIYYVLRSYINLLYLKFIMGCEQ